MKSFHIRLAELTRKRKTKPLTDAEIIEIQQCEQLNETYIESVLMLEHKIKAAEIVKDTEWESELYIQLDSLECDPHRTKVK
jgi:uncharacterized protein YnzC (UPF0291/DUF896 family)